MIIVVVELVILRISKKKITYLSVLISFVL